MSERLKSKIILFLLCSLLMHIPGWSQPQYFIYFQYEKSAAFYVKYEGQIYRSSSSGYLILSKLARGRQQLEVGLGDSGQQLLRFVWDTLSVDKGYLIKDFPDTGWGLFDLQSSEIRYPKSMDEAVRFPQKKVASDSAVNDAFGNLLAQVTQDSTVKYIALMDAEKKSENKSGAGRSAILELDRIATEKSREIRYLIKDKSRSDTVVVLMQEAVDAGVFLGSDTSAVDIHTPKSHATELILDSAMVHITPPASGVQTDSVPLITSDSILVISDSSAGPIKSSRHDCTATANEDQFVKLRMRMAGQYTEEKMIEEAREVFRQVCFTTVQLRRLSLLLGSDEMKYRFFAAAYGYTSDTPQFPSLRNELQEETYRQQFDALMANP